MREAIAGGIDLGYHWRDRSWVSLAGSILGIAGGIDLGIAGGIDLGYRGPGSILGIAGGVGVWQMGDRGSLDVLRVREGGVIQRTGAWAIGRNRSEVLR